MCWYYSLSDSKFYSLLTATAMHLLAKFKLAFARHKQLAAAKENEEHSSEKRGVEIVRSPGHMVVSVKDIGICIMPCPP